ncbi:hypothetical protein NQU49_26015, partial [Escherichia coli]|nr:hypothetical protein [Escherichia coli]
VVESDSSASVRLASAVKVAIREYEAAPLISRANTKVSDNLSTPRTVTPLPLLHGRIAGVDAIFLARHGEGHKIPPHAINYRANLWALKAA